MNNLTLLNKAISKGLKVGMLDIETAPPIFANYPMFKTTIPHSNILVDKKITSIGYKLLGEKEVHLSGWDYLGPITLYPDRVEGGGDDTKLVKELRDFINSVDIVVGQNSDAFDIKELNSRLCDLKVKPFTNKLITLDILKLSRKSFRPTSHKLDYRSKKYGLGGKIHQDMDDCIQVLLGNESRQTERIRYNGKDVTDLEKVFLRELPYETLPVAIEKMLLHYIKDEKPFCIKCAARRQRRFNVSKRKFKVAGTTKTQFKYVCNYCDYKWRIK